MYCQCGRTDARITAAAQLPDVTWPHPDKVELALERALRRCDAAVRDISLCGTGEPTLHPAFAEIAQRVVRVRDAHAPHASVSVFTSALSRPVVDGTAMPGLMCCDRRFVKLDVGSDRWLRRLAHPAPGVKLADAVLAIAELGDAEVQTMLVSGPCGNDSDEAIEEWATLCEVAAPLCAEVMTIARPPAEPVVQPTTRARLYYAASLARSRGIACFVVDPG